MDKNYFLNVQKSLKNNSWHASLESHQESLILDWQQKFGIEHQVAKILISRGIKEENLFNYLDPKLRSLLIDPLKMSDMEKAADRLIKAIQKHENIMIFGDYDVDGACSSALLARFLKFFDVEYQIYIPDRSSEKYGLSKEAVQKFKDQNIELIVALDCGSNDIEALEYARSLKIEVIVADHHQMPKIHDLAYALVNPKRPDDFSEQDYLCSAGVVFFILVQVSRQLKNQGKVTPDLMDFLDLVAFATICDIVPLSGVNRAFVKQGLIVAEKTKNIGLSLLIKSAGISFPLKAQHFSFKLGPLINAAGRIGNSRLGSSLLSENDPKIAQEIVKKLISLNKERQELQKNQINEAEQQIVFDEEGNPPPIIVLSSKNWHKGIIGIIAARLKEKYFRPTFVFAIDEYGQAVGSARSINGFDIGFIVSKASQEGFLDVGGGHAMAAGFSTSKEKISDFKDMLLSCYSDQANLVSINSVLKIDDIISARQISLEFYKKIQKIGPFGAENLEPLFVIPDLKVYFTHVVGEVHLKIIFIDNNGFKIEAMAFNEAGTYLGEALQKQKDKKFSIAGNLEVNYWNNRISPQFIIKDAAYA